MVFDANPAKKRTFRHNLNIVYHIKIGHPMNHAFWCLHLCLLFVLALLVLTSHAAASTLSLSAPSDVNICGNGSYSLSYDCSNDVSNASASILVPIGFQYSEKAKLIFNGRESFREPSTIGQLLTWDLTTALRSCRYIVINEWYWRMEAC